MLLTDRFSAEGRQRLEGAGFAVVDAPGLAPEALREKVATAHALVVRSVTQVDAALVTAARELLVVGRSGVGVENIDVAACAAAGIAVFNTPGASALTTAERTVALMLGMLHQVSASERMLRAGKWDRRAFMPREAQGKTVGVLGFGHIGRVVAAKARALGMNVLVHDRSEPAEGPFNAGFTSVDFDRLFTESDVVTVHVSGSAPQLVSARELSLMRRGGWLVNTSRGHVVDEAALVQALESGQLAGAALDVYAKEPLPAESALRRLENVILSPHLGGTSAESEARASASVADQLVRYLTNGALVHEVGRPAFLRHAPAGRPRA